MDHWLGLDTRPRMNAELAGLFERTRARGRTRELSQSTTKILVFYLLFALADIMLLGDVTALSLGLRFGVFMPLAIVVLFYLRRARPIRHKENAALALTLIGNILWCAIVVASENPMAVTYFFGAMLFQMAVTIGIRPPFRAALSATLLCFAINYSAFPLIAGGDALHEIYFLAIYLAVVLQTLIASHQLEAERLINFLQNHENERLKQELSRRNNSLEQLALTDPLTQLPNRRGTQVEIARMRGEMDSRDIGLSAVLLIDIDHFKAYNDGYGHGAGDECLTRVAAVMRRELPEEAHLSRYGGEEFLAIIPGCSPNQAVRHAEALRRAVRVEAIPHLHAGQGTPHVTISIGAACGSLASDGALETLMEAADRALYAVKGDGRNGWRLADMSPGPRRHNAA